MIWKVWVGAERTREHLWEDRQWHLCNDGAHGDKGKVAPEGTRAKGSPGGCGVLGEGTPGTGFKGLGVVPVGAGKASAGGSHFITRDPALGLLDPQREGHQPPSVGTPGGL